MVELQVPNFLNTLMQADQAAAFTKDQRHQNALRSFMQDNGAALMQGDGNVLAEYGRHDPMGAINLQGIFESRKAAAEDRAYRREQDALTNARADRQEARLSAEHQLKLREYAATASAAQLAADRDKLRRGMQAVWDAQSDQDWDASADALGYPDLKGKFSQKRAILRSLMDQDEFLDSIAPPVPLSPQGKFESDKSKGFVPPDAVYQSGGNTTVTVGGGSDLRKELSKKEGEQWASAMDAGSRAGALSQDLEMMTELSAVAPQGPVVGRFAEAFPGVNSAADAFNSVVKRVAPTLREPGSGSTSDIEYDGMLKSLPALRNKPEANAAIIGMMQAKQQIMVEKAAAVAAFQQGEASEQQTRQRLQELNSQSIMTPQLRALIGATGSQSDEAVPEGVDPSDWEYMTPEERALFQ